MSLLLLNPSTKNNYFVFLFEFNVECIKNYRATYNFLLIFTIKNPGHWNSNGMLVNTNLNISPNISDHPTTNSLSRLDCFTFIDL